MATDKPPIIERAYQDAEVWLIRIAEGLERPGELQDAYHALRAVLHVVRDNLIPDEAMDFASQLPMLVRGVYFEGYRLAGRPLKHRSRDEFLDAVRRQLDDEAGLSLDPERCVRVVFGILDEHLDDGQAAQVRDMLHKEIQQFWPSG
ncbi:MAG: DUF2267 domain-containing protein [Candidatus Wenzhouxiangella sp. M2_3B_020]